MRVKQAKAIAREWVVAHASSIDGFHGAFHAGSTLWLPDEAEVAPTSDVDVMISIGGQLPASKPGKVPYRGALLDVSYVHGDALSDAHAVLTDYHLAGAFRTPGVILDPKGELAKLQATVSREFPRSRWVYARCGDARDKIVRYLSPTAGDAPFHQQVTAWLFAAGITTHVLLAAGTRNPTVRKRYVAARTLLGDYGRLDFYPALLELLGCAGITRAQVEHHLGALAETFDDAAAVIRSPFFYASDITQFARPIAIDGSRELIDAGLHREAIFWIVATYARCIAVLHADGDDATRRRADEGFQRLLADLGIAAQADLAGRREQVRAFLPHLWETAEAVIEANPAVEA